MSMKGPYREISPVGPFAVDVQLPAGAKVGGVKLLTAGQAAQHTIGDGRLRVLVPSVEVHEVVAIDLA
jgi:hypothetical protein